MLLWIIGYSLLLQPFSCTPQNWHPSHPWHSYQWYPHPSDYPHSPAVFPKQITKAESTLQLHPIIDSLHNSTVGRPLGLPTLYKEILWSLFFWSQSLLGMLAYPSTVSFLVRLSNTTELKGWNKCILNGHDAFSTTEFNSLEIERVRRPIRGGNLILVFQHREAFCITLNVLQD